MAFGRGSATGVARADVEFRAETGKFEADVTQAKLIYERAVGAMSDETLRMSVAQEKLDRAISRFGPESIQARTAAVAYRRELSQLRHEEDRVSRSARRVSNDLTRIGRGSIAASGAFKGLGNALFFASGAFAGGFGIIYALRTTIQAAARAEVSVTKLAQAVRNSGISWRGNRKQILDTLDAQSKLTAFDDEELQDTFGALIIRTKDVTSALELNALAANVARARNVELDAAMRLVLRASLGQTSSLRRLGIDVEKVTTEQDKLRASGVKVTFQQRQQAKAADARATQLSVIAELEAKFAKQGEEFATTAAGRQEYFNKVLEDTQEIIGTALLPTVNDLLTRFSDWLDRMNRTGETQKQVNQILEDTGTIIHGVTDFVNELRGVLGPLTDAFGGTYESVKLVIEIMAVGKLVKIATSVRGIAVAWGFVGPAATTAAATTVAAETAIGTGALAQIPKIAALRAALVSLGGVAGVAAGGALLSAGAAAGLVTVKGLSEIDEALFSPSTVEQAKTIAKVMGRQSADAQKKTWQNMSPSMRAAVSAVLRKQNRYDILAAVGATDTGVATAPGEEGVRVGPQAGGAPKPTGGTGRAGRPARTAVDISLDLARSEAQQDESSQIKYHRELADLYRRQAANLEKRKNLTLLQKQKLTQLYSQIDSEEAAIASIVSGQQSEARAAASARAAAARARHEKHKARIDTRAQFLENQLLRAAESEGLKDDAIWSKRLMAHYRKAANDEELTAKERQMYENKRLTVRKRLRTARQKANEIRQEAREQRLINATERAELTDTLKDDERTLKVLIAYYRAREKNRDLSEQARLAAEKKRIAAQQKLKKLKDDDAKKGVGFESGAAFLAGLQGVLNTYGGNLFAPGELRLGGRAGDEWTAKVAGSHAIIQTSLLRDQNRVLRYLASQTRLPASRAGYTNATSIYDGYAT